MQSDNLFENIKSIRESLGMTQEELALKVGYSDRSMICRLEAGAVDPSHSKIHKIAAALGVTYADLMGWESEAADDAASPHSVVIPVYDAIVPDHPEKQKSHLIRYELIPSAWPGEYFALQLSDGAGLPEFPPGDTLIVRKQETAKNKAIVLALCNNKKVVLHRYIKMKTFSLLLPLKEDPSSVQVADRSLYSNRFRIIGCVVETRRRHC